MKLTFLDPKTLFKALSYLVVFEVVFLLLFVIRPLISSYTNLSVERDFLKKEIKNLEDKKFFLVDQDALIRSEKELFSSLEEVIPEKENLHMFLIDLVKVSSETGFDIVDFYPYHSRNADNNEITMSVEVRGNTYRIADLISRIYSIKRKPVIEAIKTDISYSSGKAELTLKIYYLNSIPLDFPEGKDAKIDIEFLKNELKPAHERY